MRRGIQRRTCSRKTGYSAGQVAAIVQGRALGRDAFMEGAVAEGEVALIGPDGTLVAVAEHVLSGRGNPDGIHWNFEAHQAVAELMLKALAEAGIEAEKPRG